MKFSEQKLWTFFFFYIWRAGQEWPDIGTYIVCAIERRRALMAAVDGDDDEEEEPYEDYIPAEGDRIPAGNANLQPIADLQEEEDWDAECML